MTKRERVLLIAFATIASISLFSIYSIVTYDRIETAKASVLKYGSAASNVSGEPVDRTALEREIAALRANDEDLRSQGDYTQTEIAAHVKRELSARGIEPSRIQTGKAGGAETVEFLLECKSPEFFSFLKANPAPGHHWRYTLVAVKSTPTGETISVTLRLVHE